MPKLPTLRHRKKVFTDIQTLDVLATILETPRHIVELNAATPQYNMFTVPKKNGERRLIENPIAPLKAIQGKLNDFMQAVYWFIKPPSAYGFIINPDKSLEPPRSILTNAQQHLGKAWLLNADLEDFFHFVTAEQVFQVLLRPPFDFSEKVADTITRLTTLNGRLPMGAPTSPVLSNLVFMPMDADLLTYSANHEWHFTRYADDMSFSSEREIEWVKTIALEDIVKKYGFLFKKEKVKLFGPDDVKLVTGLRLDNVEGRVELPDDFSVSFAKEMDRLKGILSVQSRLWHEDVDWVRQYKQQIDGKLSFAVQILGENHPDFIALTKQYNAAIEPPDEYDSISWLDFNYF